jgi:hypothetical protein
MQLTNQIVDELERLVDELTALYPAPPPAGEAAVERLWAIAGMDAIDFAANEMATRLQRRATA